MKSKVFQAMFSHNMSENRENVVRIDDVRFEVIEEMLFYIYHGKANNLSKMPQEIFGIAHQYDIIELKNKCQEYFIFNVTYQNVISILDMASLYGLPELKKSAMSFVSNHEQQMVREDSFHKFLCRDLKMNTLASTLKLCDKYSMQSVKSKAFEFVKKYNQAVAKNPEFLAMFTSHPQLMKALYVYIHN